MSLINREELLKSIMDDSGLQHPKWWYIDKIKTAPEAVTHCKNCKHYHFSEIIENCACFLGAGMCEAEPDDFCSRGEEREKMNKGKYVILTTGDSFEVGEYIVYVCGDRYEIGRVKSLRENGAFVYYHEGDTAAKTPYDCMHKLVNGYCIKESTLGGALSSAWPEEENCDTCKRGDFGGRQCDNCCVRYPSHYERKDDGRPN